MHLDVKHILNHGYMWNKIILKLFQYFIPDVTTDGGLKPK